MGHKAKFYVDFCFEAGNAGIYSYWFEMEMTESEETERNF